MTTAADPDSHLHFLLIDGHQFDVDDVLGIEILAVRTSRRGRGHA